MMRMGTTDEARSSFSEEKIKRGHPRDAIDGMAVSAVKELD